MAGLQPVRRQQPVLRRPVQQCRHRVFVRRPRDQGELQPPVRHARPRSDQLPVQRRIPDGALPRGQRLRRQVLSGVDTRSARGADLARRATSRRRFSQSATTSTGRAGSAPTSRRRATPASTSRSSAATKSTGRRGGSRASTARTRRIARWSATRTRCGGVKLDPLPECHDRHLARHALRPAVADGGRPENALIGSIWTVNSGTSAITVPASMAGLRLWRNTRVARPHRRLRDPRRPARWATNGAKSSTTASSPAGLIHLSSTTVNGVEKILDFGETVGIGTATHNLTLYRHKQRRARLRRQHRAVGVGARRQSRPRLRAARPIRRCSRRR